MTRHIPDHAPESLCRGGTGHECWGGIAGAEQRFRRVQWGPPPSPSGPLIASGEVAEYKNDLHSLDRKSQKNAVKRVIAAMTVGKDVSSLFPGTHS